MKPTIGRIVHFRADGALPGDTSAVRPAVVTRVWSDRCVNLEVFGEPADTAARFPTSVEEGGPETPRSWFWPPRE